MVCLLGKLCEGLFRLHVGCSKVMIHEGAVEELSACLLFIAKRDTGSNHTTNTTTTQQQHITPTACFLVVYFTFFTRHTLIFTLDVCVSVCAACDSSGILGFMRQLVKVSSRVLARQFACAAGASVNVMEQV
eukprot:c11739_g2_i1.p2 GENE.c11739_g2_i1~~c11739_g2_i1.p2  ORF type:complete len:132 (-),score=26.04 c11739_g2_i1:564-959(-)